MQNKLLSVVVPVYKVEKYINKCLDSLIISDEQMNLLEVIVVNDGTPDNSAIMAKEYERKYPNTFRVIDKENGGHGSAWNRGVQEAMLGNIMKSNLMILVHTDLGIRKTCAFG